jgi:hypothetical protein
MPSEAAPGRFDWLRSQGLGFVCGQLCVLLLGVGSVVIAATRDGHSAGLQLDDLRPFFLEPWWGHSWFYALLGVIGLYALNTALCTWDSMVARWRRGASDVSAWAPTVIHVSWLVALLSHLVGGLANLELEPVLVTGEWTQVDPGLAVRLTKLESDYSPSGKLTQTHATLEVRDAQGRVSADVVGYNEPLSRGVGSELLLIAQAGRAPGVVAFSLGAWRCRVVVPGECVLGATRLEVDRLQQAERLGNRVVAVVREGANGFPIVEGSTHALAGGELRFESVGVEDVVQLRHRHAPGNPVAFVSAVLLAVGLVMMGRRWIRPVGE